MKQKLNEIKKSIEDFSRKSEEEKGALMESIEMFWLNADIQRKKTEVIIPKSADENILRIRQLLAAAWSEDYSEK